MSAILSPLSVNGIRPSTFGTDPKRAHLIDNALRRSQIAAPLAGMV